MYKYCYSNKGAIYAKGLCKRANDAVFNDFPKISDHFPKISEDFPKLFQRPDERFRRFFRMIPNISRRLPKIAEADRRRSEDVSIVQQQILV